MATSSRKTALTALSEVTENEGYSNIVIDKAICAAELSPRDAALASTLKGLISNGIVERRSYDEIPPRVEYSLTEKGASVVPILQSICQWAGAFYKDEGEAPMIQCRKCDHH